MLSKKKFHTCDDVLELTFFFFLKMSARRFDAEVDYQNVYEWVSQNVIL